jgi:hypothetical protein
MAKETTYAGTLGEWLRFLQALVANIGELGHLEGSRAKLAGILERAQALTEQQSAATAAKQEASRQLRTLVFEGRRLTTVLRLAVKEHYGIRSEKLAEFGLQPFRGRKAKAVVPEIEKTSTPAE